MQKTKMMQCPVCGGRAHESLVAREVDPICPEYIIETNECEDCGARWDEIIKRVYYGYRMNLKIYNANGEEICGFGTNH